MSNVHAIVAALPHEAANDAARASIRVAASRFVTIELAASITGLTESAIRMKIHKGVWLENRQWRKRDGRVFIDILGYELWVEKGQA